MLHIYTYHTAPEKAQFLEQSAKLHTVDLQNVSTTTEWKGFSDKLSAIRAKLDSLLDTDIVCFVDAYDVIVNASSSKILEVFKSFDTDIVFGAEIDLFPHTLKHLESNYPTAESPFRFLNSGCYIGYVHALKKMFGWQDFQGRDDQEYCQMYFLEHFQSGHIKLDTSGKLVINMSRVPWQALKIESGVVEFMPFNTVPCFLHFNGMSYMDVDKDFVDIGDNKRGFSYDKIYDRTFLAILGAKFVSERSPLRLQLTSNGHTYKPPS